MQKLYRAALAAIVVCSFVACNANTVDTPTTSSVPEPVASTSTPTPTATPAAPPAPGAGEGQEANDGYLIEFENNAGFKVTNKTDIGQAYRAYTTNFDNQEVETAFKVSGTVPPEEAWGDSFNATCVQLDITQFGYAGLPLKGGAAFFDKNGKQFNPSRSPEKVTECRCTPTWQRSEKYETLYGEWVVAQDGCSRTRTVTYRYYETQTCTNDKRTVDVQQKDEFGQLQKFETKGFLVVDGLSNSGSNYKIRESTNSFVSIFDPTVLGPFSYTAGQTYEYERPINGKYLGLFYEGGFFPEKLDTVRAQCSTEISADWRGNLTFDCRKVDVCQVR